MCYKASPLIKALDRIKERGKIDHRKSPKPDFGGRGCSSYSDVPPSGPGDELDFIGRIFFTSFAIDSSRVDKNAFLASANALSSIKASADGFPFGCGGADFNNRSQAVFVSSSTGAGVARGRGRVAEISSVFEGRESTTPTGR